jgi:hypothetical protein
MIPHWLSKHTTPLMSPVPGLGQQSDTVWQGVVVVLDQLMQHWWFEPHTMSGPWQSVLDPQPVPKVPGISQVPALAPAVAHTEPSVQSLFELQLVPSVPGISQVPALAPAVAHTEPSTQSLFELQLVPMVPGDSQVPAFELPAILTPVALQLVSPACVFIVRKGVAIKQVLAGIAPFAAGCL